MILSSLPSGIRLETFLRKHGRIPVGGSLSTNGFGWKLSPDWAPLSGGRSKRKCIRHLSAFTMTAIGSLYSMKSGILPTRSEEHTSELQSRRDLVCRLLLEKKKKHK